MNRFTLLAVYGLLLLLTRHMHLVLHPAGFTVSVPFQVLLAAPMVITVAVLVPLVTRSVMGLPLLSRAVTG